MEFQPNCFASNIVLTKTLNPKPLVLLPGAALHRVQMQDVRLRPLPKVLQAEAWLQLDMAALPSLCPH